MAFVEPNLLQLKFLGSPLGALAYRPDGPVHALELDRAFLASGHDLSPLSLPLDSFATGPRLFQPGDTPFAGGLPGLIADSLPDAWGERMLRHEMPEVQTLLGKLAAIGPRGPGAITFEPVLGAGADQNPTAVDLAALARDADRLRATPVPLTAEHVNAALAKGGSTLGGAFPKASVHLRLEGELNTALSPALLPGASPENSTRGLHSPPVAGLAGRRPNFTEETPQQATGNVLVFIERHEILVGGAPPTGYSPWILKFARSSDEAEGAVEFAFWLMAKNAGIRLPRACLVSDGERRHFAVERFDRYRRADEIIGRRHVHSLSGMMHRKAADGAIDYEDFMRLSRRLGGAQEAVECFRRAVFNLLATNRDDHGRNHLFLYDETARTWTLAPAFDLNPSIYNVLIALHWLGSAQIPTQFASLLRLAEIGGISARTAREIYAQVEAATLGGWRAAATQAGVPAAMIAYWEKEMIQQTQPLRDNAKATGRKS